MVAIEVLGRLRLEFLEARAALTRVAETRVKPEQGINLEVGRYGWNTALQSLLTKSAQSLEEILACIPEDERDNLRRHANALKGVKDPQSRHNKVRSIINSRFPGLYEMPSGGIYQPTRRLTLGGVPLVEFDLLWINPEIVDKGE